MYLMGCSLDNTFVHTHRHTQMIMYRFPYSSDDNLDNLFRLAKCEFSISSVEKEQWDCCCGHPSLIFLTMIWLKVMTCSGKCYFIKAQY